MAEIVKKVGRFGSERGAELIEFALVLPLLLLVVLGIVDFGFMFQRLEVVTNAAREGARMAVLQGYGTTDVEDRVEAYMSDGGIPLVTGGSANFDIDISDYDIPITGTTIPGKRVSVTFYHQVLFLSGMSSFFGGAFSSVPLRGTAIMQDEG